MNKLKLIYIVTVLTVMLFANVGTAKNVATFPELTKPGEIVIDNGQLFITNETTIYVHSMKEFKLLKKFGKKGEGPREFMLNPMLGGVKIDVLPDSILVNSFGKVSLFSKACDFQKEIKVRTMSTHFKPIGNDFVGTLITFENDLAYMCINIFDGSLEKQNEIYKEKLASQPGKVVNPTVSRGTLFYIVEGSKIFVDSADGIINVFDKSGKKLYSITHDYEKIKVTEEHKKKYLDFFENDPATKAYFNLMKNLIKFPEFFPPIRYYHVIGDKIYVLTFKEEDNNKEFLIFDLKGNLLKRTMLPLQVQSAIQLNPYTFKDMKFYQLVESEDETWQLQAVLIQ